MIILQRSINSICGATKWSQFQNAAVIIDHPRKIKTDDVLYINNYTDPIKYEKISNRIYYVMHSDLCPVNVVFTENERYYHGIVCTNICSYDKCRRLYPMKDIIYIPNTYKPRICSRIRNRYCTIHYVGRISSEKNVIMLIDAVKQLRRENLQVILKIFGTGSGYRLDKKYIDHVKYIVKYQRTDNVTFEGRIDSKDVLYYGADLVVLPSVHEGLPYCLLEAKAYGVKFVVNNQSRLDETFTGEDGTFFKYNGYCMDDYKDVLHTSYQSLLCKIGYVRLKLRGGMGNTIEHIKYLSRIARVIPGRRNFVFRHSVHIPPYLIDTECDVYRENLEFFKRKLLLYESNVELLKNAIKQEMARREMF